MKKTRCKEALSVLLSFLFLFLSPLSCFALSKPAPPQDTSAFLQWYEQNKNTDNAVYTLSGNLFLTQEESLTLSGNGRVTIDCGIYSIIIASSVTLNNPNLTVCANGLSVFQVNDGSLTLEKGSIRLSGEQGSAIDVYGGELHGSSDAPNPFCIVAEGVSVTGVKLNSQGLLPISNLSITVTGTRSAIGIAGSFGSVQSIEDCILSIQSAQNAYGIFTPGNLELTNLHLSAQGGETACGIFSAASVSANGCTVSAQTTAGNTAESVQARQWAANDCILTKTPSILEKNCYAIWEQVTDEPVYYRTVDGFSDNMLPAFASFYLEDLQTDEQLLMEIPIRWNMNETELSADGLHTLTGKPDTAGLDVLYLNPYAAEPVLYLVQIPESGTFLETYRVSNNVPEQTKIQLIISYPYEAESFSLEYSTDQDNWTPYVNDYEETNLLAYTHPTV